MVDVATVIGPPGTGKTRTVLKIAGKAAREGEKVVVCSLTRAAAQEAAVRGRGSAITVRTLHSLAWESCDRPKIATGKDEIQEWNGYIKNKEPCFMLKETTDKDMDTTSPPMGETPGDVLHGKYELCRNRCVEFEERSVHEFAEQWEAWKEESDYYDFHDVIEQAQHSLCPGNPTMFLGDEMQDHSRLELNLIKAWAEHCERLVIVGDPWQAIYEWRGAHPQMFSKAKGGSRTILEQSYRLPQPHVDNALSWAKELFEWEDIRYKGLDTESIIKNIPTNYSWARGAVELAEREANAGRSTIICASCNYMIKPTIAILRANCTPFGNPWRLKRSDWNPLARRQGVNLIDRIKAFFRPIKQRYSPKGVAGELEQSSLDDPDAFDVVSGGDEAPPTWTTAEYIKWVPLVYAQNVLHHGVAAKLKKIKKDDPMLGRPPDFPVMLQEDFTSTDDAMRFMKKNLKALFKNGFDYNTSMLEPGKKNVDRPLIHIGNIHSFKGAEADNVIIYPDLSRMGFRSWNDVATRDQVVRMFYVAMTRSKRGLYVAAPTSSLNPGDLLNGHTDV